MAENFGLHLVSIHMWKSSDVYKHPQWEWKVSGVRNVGDILFSPAPVSGANIGVQLCHVCGFIFHEGLGRHAPCGLSNSVGKPRVWILGSEFWFHPNKRLRSKLSAELRCLRHQKTLIAENSAKLPETDGNETSLHSIQRHWRDLFVFVPFCGMLIRKN